MFARIEVLICMVAFAMLLLASGLNRQPLIYDEPHRLEVVDVLREKGFSRDFLEQMPHATGPLTPALQFALAPITRLDPRGLRLTNVLLLGLLILVTAGTLGRAGHTAKWSASLAIMALPTTWVVAGLALTEMPAMCCVGLAAALIQLLLLTDSPRKKYVFAALAGTALALASLGRQPYVLLLLPLPILAWNRRGDAGPLALCAAWTLFPLMPVFAVWHGLVPPSIRSVGEGVSLPHGVLAFAYAGAFVLLYAPGWLSRDRMVLGAVAGCVVLVLVLGGIHILPFETGTRRILPAALLPVWTRLVSGAFAGLAFWFASSLAFHTWRNRGEALTLFLAGGVFLTLAADFKITGNFSSRYVAMTFPLLIPLLASTRLPQSRWAPARSLLGATFGAMQLWSYFLSQSTS